MTKQEFLAASLPYRAKFINKVTYEDAVMLLHGVVFDEVLSQYGKFSIKDAKPIIRPLDSLTTECVQTDYNDGKPFIPIKELERLFPYCNFYLLDDNGKIVIGFDNRDYDNDVTIEDMMLIIQQLLKWHFWINMPESEEVVYVTNEFNPYK